MRRVIAAAIVLAAAPARADRLAHRTTAMPGFGFARAEGGGGLAIDAVVQHTWDRAELHGDVAVADWLDKDTPMRGGTFARLGLAAGYQAARSHAEPGGTLDAVVEVGAGWQRLAWDTGGARNTPDLSLGVDLRWLSDLGAEDGGERIFLGMEASGRVLVTPDGDVGMLLTFGCSSGR